MSVYYFLCLGLYLCIHTVNGVTVTEKSHSSDYYVSGEQFYDPLQVKEYYDYGSVTVFPFRMPERVSHARWQLIKHRSDAKCPKLTMEVALQNGSFPIVNPLNQSFPDNMYRSNPDLPTYQIPDELSLMLMVNNPNPGYWFIVAYLPQDDDDRIKQEGLSRECYYFVQAIMSYKQVATVQTLSDKANTPYTIEEDEDFALFRYYAEANLESIQISITGCTSRFNNSIAENWCPISLSLEANQFPLASEPRLVCNSTKREECAFTVLSPWQDSWYYLRVNKTLTDTPIALDFSVDVGISACTQQSTNRASFRYEDEDETIWYRRTNMSDDANNAYRVFKQQWPAISERVTGVYEEAVFMSPPDGTLYTIAPDESIPESKMADCPKTVTLSSIEGSSSPFKKFIRTDGNDTDLYTVPIDGRVIVKFFLDPVLDIGGTIEVKANIDSKNVSTSEHNITVKLCLRQGSPPTSNNGTSCASEFGFTVQNNEPVIWHIPFPAGGWWYMSMEAVCIFESSEEQCPSSVITRLDLSMIECINHCGPNGRCHVYHKDGFQIYGCVCDKGYGGWACTDDSDAWSRAYFLTQVLLLTLSNIFFLLPFAMATYRRYFAEGVVYLCTLIFSTFYHACDSSRFCIMDYNTLQFCDFFAAFMAIFITLIAMAKLPSSLKQTLHMLGTFGLALGTTYNRFSLWAAAVPIACGVIVVLSSWGYRWNKRRRCYPSKKRWLLFIVPGIAITTSGLLIFAFFETENNYQYVHSVWHACMALGVLLLLPPRSRKDSDSDDMWSVVQTETYTPMGTGAHDNL